MGALLHHLATLAVSSTVEEAALAHAHAASHAQRVEDTANLHLHTRALKAGNLRSRSSHGLRANVFRAASALRSHSSLRTQQAPVLYVPKMGLANVTEPTPFPPPPPVLHPWQDHQPLDTAIGNYLISGFIQAPTITPPPSQSSLDLAFACPALLTWPNEVSVSAPDPCGSMETGNWTGKGGGLQIQWATSCIDTTSPGLTPPSISAVTTYTVPNGDLFGTSQERQVMFNDFTEIRDCGGAAIYTIEEKLYKQAGKPDPDACKNHKSCDGVIYFQWFIKDASGRVVALTPYTTIFQESFPITDLAGGTIAEVSRTGWQPDQRTPCTDDAKPRLWNLKFASSPPGNWAAATNQWPIASFITMLAHRDMFRQPNGRVLWSNCEVLKATGYAFSVTAGVCCCVCIPMVIFLLCSAWITRCVTEAEKSLFPKRMGKPAMYGN